MKKLLSLLLVLSLSVTLLGGSVLAAEGNDAPFELVAALNEDNTVTLSLKTTEEMAFMAIKWKLSVPTGFTLTAIEQGSNYSDFHATLTKNIETAEAFIDANNVDDGTVVAGGNELVTYTLVASSANAGDYTFGVEFIDAIDSSLDDLAWKGATITSNAITIETTDDPNPAESVVVTREVGESYSSFAPYIGGYSYSLAEFIYDKNIILAAGTITAVAFQVILNTKSVATDSVKIYMGYTDKSVFDNSIDWVDPETLTLVYTGSPTLGQELGWETLTLDTPFQYDNSKNLVFAVSKASSSTASANYLQYGAGGSTTAKVALCYQSKTDRADIDNIDATTYGFRDVALPNIQLTFDASDVCTHEKVSTVSVDNKDGTHTITSKCDICGVVFSTVTEEHTFDREKATLEGNQCVAVCTVCDAEETLNITGKTLMTVQPATELKVGKTYIITAPDGSYAMSVESSPTKNGTGTIRVRHAVPVWVINDELVVFEDDSEILGCQWEYTEDGHLKAYSELNGETYIGRNPHNMDSLWTNFEADKVGVTSIVFEWTYTDDAVTSTDGGQIVFSPEPFSQGTSQGAAPYFGARGESDLIATLYEVTNPIPTPGQNDLGVTVEVHKDYVGGCSLIVVYGDADADGYLYDGNAMYRTPSYDDEEKGTAFAYIVEGEVTEKGVLDVLTEAEDAAVDVTVSKIYDVNGTGAVDISDVQAVADCYNYDAETDDAQLAAYMPVYLRADVDANHKVEATDANLVLRNRE